MKIDYVAVILLVVLGMVFVIIFPTLPEIGLVSTVISLPESEPANVIDCQVLSGVCVPANQKCYKGLLEYGLCDDVNVCCIHDLCESTGGRWNYQVKSRDGWMYFEQVCQCPLPLVYESVNGCSKIYW